jgi:RNA polymerase sigma-32 factor
MAPTKTTTSTATLSIEAERELSRRWQAASDTRALADLVNAHLGLVIKIATEFRNSGPSMEDLIQEGHVGLTIAARRFDPAKATRLATYATYWIRACMMEYVVRSHGPVRIGTTRSQRKIFFGLGRARRRLEREGQGASAEQLARVLGVAPGDVEAMATRLSGHDVSLDAPRSSDDERRAGSLLAADLPTQEDLFADGQEEDSRKQLLGQALQQLDPRERAILKARHMSARPTTLGALGKKFGISRERVRQLELRAVAKLRNFCSAERAGASAGPNPRRVYCTEPGGARVAA